MVETAVKVLFYVVAGLVLIAGGVGVAALILRNRFTKKELLRFKYSVSGDYSGGHYLMEIAKIDEEKAKISISQAKRHDQEPVEEEYTVDRKVLDELKMVFLKEGICNWNKMKFSRVFVSDGATYRYGFFFPDEETVTFHSQFFPHEYGEKLGKLDSVIRKYLPEKKAEE